MATTADQPTSGSTPVAASFRRSVTGRAALAVALLIGYFVLAAAVVGGLAWLTVLAVTGGSTVVGGKLGILALIIAVAVGRAVLAVERSSEDAAYDGVAAHREDQPRLWRLVDEVAAELGVDPPDDLWLRDDVNAYVRQDTRLLGLVAGRRHMCLGMGLVQVLTVDELRGVVAHELGHYAGGDARLGGLVYRAGSTIERTVVHLGPTSLAGRLFHSYAKLYNRVSFAVRRRQELRADEGAVRVAGQQAHESALRTTHAAGPAYQFFLQRYVAPLWQSGTAPQDLYPGLRSFVDDPEREEQMQALRAEDGEPTGAYDSHPGLSARVAHLRSLPDRPAPGDRRPARALLTQPELVERDVTGWLNGRLLTDAPERLYAFTGPLDPAPYVAELSEIGAHLSESTARVDGGPQPAGLGRILTLLETGRDAELVTVLTADRREFGPQARWNELCQLVGGPLAAAAAVALATAGRASWRVSWSQVRELDGPDGEPLNVAQLLLEALDQEPPRLREVMVELGVPLDDAAVVLPGGSAGPTEERDGLLAIWPEVRRGQKWFDLLVTRRQLVVVPQRRSLRLRFLRGASAQYGLGKTQRRQAAQKRVDALLAGPLAELAGRPGVLTVVWDDTEQLQLRRGVANAWVLQVSGAPKPLDRLRADDLLAPPPEQVHELLHRLVGPRLMSNAAAKSSR